MEFLSAIPKTALFLLFVVAGLILAEIIYLTRKKLTSREVSIPFPKQVMATVTTEIVKDSQRKRRFSFNRKTTFILLSTLLIALTIPLGAYLVKQRQITEKQAAGCDARWPADPGTSCGITTQSPAQGATGVSLTPNFHWDYGGYRPEDNGQCINPQGCTNGYHVQILLSKTSIHGNPGEQYVGTCDINSMDPIPKDASLSCFSLTSLEPNTDYWWLPMIGYCWGCAFHTGYSWNYHFKTGTNATPTPTPTPTATPTPTPTPTATPTPTPTPTATPTPTPRPTATPTPTPPGPTPTPTPTPQIACWSSCTADSQCGSGRICKEISEIKRCVNSRCETESDCVCNAGCYSYCGADNECSSGQVCRKINGANKCVNPVCAEESDCNCTVAAPVIPVTPQAGNNLPTVAAALGGTLLLILGLLL